MCFLIEFATCTNKSSTETHEDNLVDGLDEIEKPFVSFSEGIFNNRNNCIIDYCIPNIVDNIMNREVNQAIFGSLIL